MKTRQLPQASAVLRSRAARVFGRPATYRKRSGNASTLVTIPTSRPTHPTTSYFTRSVFRQGPTPMPSTPLSLPPFPPQHPPATPSTTPPQALCSADYTTTGEQPPPELRADYSVRSFFPPVTASLLGCASVDTFARGGGGRRSGRGGGSRACKGGRRGWRGGRWGGLWGLGG